MVIIASGVILLPLRRKLTQTLEENDDRWLARLLENEKAVAPFLKFLKTTGIGGRDRAKHRARIGEKRRENPKVAIN